MRPYAIIDLHCDTLTDCMHAGSPDSNTLDDPARSLSLSNLPQDVHWAQFFAVFLPDRLRGEEAGEMLCLTDEAGITGLLHYAPGRAACEIRHLAVRADCRGQGLAQRLLGMLRARTGGQKCTVWARQGNTPAERFYEKNDFRPDGWTSVVLRLD